jgi:DNA anti-recombination protein RmuC
MGMDARKTKVVLKACYNVTAQVRSGLAKREEMPESTGMSMEEENQRLREQLTQREERIQQQSLLIEQMQEQIAALTRQVKDVQDRLAKDSHNSSLPPSSDRFVRQPPHPFREMRLE